MRKKEKKCVRDRNFEREKNFLRFSYEENKFFSRVLVTASSITLFSFLSRFPFFFPFCNSFFFLSPEVFFLLLCCRMVQNLRYVLLMPPRNRRNLMFPYTLSVLIECHCSPTWESTRLHYLLVASIFLPVILFNVCIIAAIPRVVLDTTCSIISIHNGV